MNKITKYIDALPLSDAEKSALPDTSLQAVHQAPMTTIRPSPVKTTPRWGRSRHGWRTAGRIRCLAISW